ncbi:MAG TPA: class II aldolase/adducin family protein [Stellaceae bacterium]|nr:class II aldolase/adducin family protein [Stellaceae bacterium]
MAEAETMPANPVFIEDLVAANRILSNEGVVDGFGHVSVRHDGASDVFLLARSMAPGLVTAADIMQFGLDGEVRGDDRRTAYVERYIHSEIYKAQPEVVAIVHSHSPAVIPFGVTAARLRPVYHMSSFLGTEVPVFEIRDTHGDATDMLIRSPALGAALAQRLGHATVALMRGHGNVVVGRSLPEVVFRAIYTEMNARLQTEALRLGDGQVTYLSDAEAAASMATNAGVLTRAWELWKAAALAKSH